MIAAVVRIADIAIQALREFCLGHPLNASEIEYMVGSHACVVDTMSKLALELFDLLFKVDLIEEQSSHFFLHLLFRSLSDVRMGTLICVASFTKIA